MLGLLDDIARILPLNDSGVPCAFNDSHNESVRAWVTDTLETYRNQAERVTVDVLSH